MTDLSQKNKGTLLTITTFVSTLINVLGIISPEHMLVLFILALLLLIVDWVLSERSKDNQHRRDMEIKSVGSTYYLTIVAPKKPRSKT